MNTLALPQANDLTHYRYMYCSSIVHLCGFHILLQESAYSSLVKREVQSANMVVLFLGSEVTAQVRDELNALQDWQGEVKAVVVCVGDSGR